MERYKYFWVAILLFSVDGRRQIFELAKVDSPRFAIGKNTCLLQLNVQGIFTPQRKKMCIKEGKKWAKTDCRR